MKVLLTGATGFVGSHILDELRRRRIPTVVMVRAASASAFSSTSSLIEVVEGDLTRVESLRAATREVTHIIHCAGLTKALRVQDFYEVNQHGVERLVEAVNYRGRQIRRLELISSLAAAGPATLNAPAREDDPPAPVSHYGRSKLAGEQAVLMRCGVPWTILRPPAVYGPRDREFLQLFKLAKWRLLPLPGGGRQALSLIYVKDLATAVVECLLHPKAENRCYYPAAREIVTAREMGLEAARQLGKRAAIIPVPLALLWPICALQDLLSRITGKPNVLGSQKIPELRAPAWVCDSHRLEQEIGSTAQTLLPEGIKETLQWYRAQQWL